MTSVKKKLGATDIYHEFDTSHFTSGAPTECPGEVYDIDYVPYSSNTGSMTSSTTGTVHRATPNDLTVIGTYQFDARVKLASQTNYFTKMYQLQVVCGTGSVTLIEPSGFSIE